MDQMGKSLSERISSRILVRRSEMSLSQKELGKQIGVTYQQTHKYETGNCDVPVSRLAKIAQVLNRSPLSFFEGEVEILQPVLLAASSPGRMKLLEAYKKLGPSERSLLISIAKSLVEATATAPVAEARSLKRASEKGP
jgi:transcriptional regulator with XRE-family HTH domain